MSLSTAKGVGRKGAAPNSPGFTEGQQPGRVEKKKYEQVQKTEMDSGAAKTKGDIGDPQTMGCSGRGGQLPSHDREHRDDFVGEPREREYFPAKDHLGREVEKRKKVQLKQGELNRGKGRVLPRVSRESTGAK